MSYYTPPARPFECESWCESHGYEPCTCDLEERQARWDRMYRSLDAAELPRAVLVKTKRDQDA